MTAYYNENNPHAAQTLRNLIAERLIAPGYVDERSIEDVRPVELAGYTQCHFFAGIGGWSVALRLAGWPDDRPVWTGSCPCQPFSAAGKGAGFADERHLWPAFFHLIGQRQPPTVLGEQVASKDGLNWLDLVRSDLEAEGYAFGAADLCAAGFGAPHIRQRLFWVADASSEGLERLDVGALGHERTAIERGGSVGGLANADGWDAGSERQQRGGEQRQQPEDGGDVRWMADAAGGRNVAGIARPDQRGFPAGDGGDQGRAPAGPTNGHWRAADWLHCRDERWRPVEPGTFPLAHGVQGRVGLLRGYGNAIVPQVAAAFIEAYEGSR